MIRFIKCRILFMSVMCKYDCKTNMLLPCLFAHLKILNSIKKTFPCFHSGQTAIITGNNRCLIRVETREHVHQHIHLESHRF